MDSLCEDKIVSTKRKRKSPRLHRVDSHMRKGKVIAPYTRGKGMPPKPPIHISRVRKTSEITPGDDNQLGKIVKVLKGKKYIVTLEHMSADVMKAITGEDYDVWNVFVRKVSDINKVVDGNQFDKKSEAIKWAKSKVI